MDLNWRGCLQQVDNIIGSGTQTVTAVPTAWLTCGITGETFGFWYSKLFINNKKNLNFWQIILFDIHIQTT